MSAKRTLAALAIGLISSASFLASAHAFQEAPMLAEKVAAGELPPVDERLPENPTVLEAVEVGQYGGTWQRAYKGPGDRWGPTKLMEERVLKWEQGDDGVLRLVPAYIESYEVNEDSTEYTFTLLAGLKWSDGEPVTTEDVRFWYEDIFLNPEIVPVIDPTFSPGGKPMEVEIVDERTFKVKFAEPYVYFLQILAKDSTGEPSLDRPSFLFPKHYLAQFNDKYASKEELEAAAKKYGAEKWTDLWGSKGVITAWWSNPDLPVITAWKIERPAPGDVVTMVRNPYYYAVDQEGNQLPYIDRIEHKLFQEQESFNLMVVQGQIDMQMRYASTADFTFYKENEEKGNFRVGNSTSATTWSLVPNYNMKDEVLRKLFEEKDFRHALNLAIDRELINELAFSGLAEGRQAAPISGSPYYREDLEKHWAEYDPDAANELLDGLGLTERDSGGFRLRPDGQRLAIVVESAHPDKSTVLELAADNLRDVGIELLPRMIDRTQWDSNRDNNDFQVHLYTFDRLSVVPADPRIMMGNDSYANQYYVWYSTEGASGIEPPADHPIRQVWAAWDKASTAGSLEEADAAVNEMIETFVTEGWVIGLVGEEAVPAIVSNNFINFVDGKVEDDVTRGVGLSQPQQMWIKQ
ncbi:ABC transporter substrate-binding protein [Chelativorans xinjiangense]|uniref:ABC transporter substrate-binding protein n=1 Tax=Chelativorans xinjiangense TaxID=2681485 RepID=UPI00135AF4EB|nr:ABC transporter substrate-binding protein [Chelativorans xinjiangense]